MNKIMAKINKLSQAAYRTSDTHKIAQLANDAEDLILSNNWTHYNEACNAAWSIVNDMFQRQIALETKGV
jgi:hypothetical protein